MAIHMIVEYAKLAAAAAKMAEALLSYRESTKNVKSAADDLASKWEGATRDSFVEDQEKAYNWYNQIAEVVSNVIQLAKDCLEQYQETEERMKSIMKS